MENNPQKPPRDRVSNVELEKRIRIIQEWIIDDWPYTDIVTQITTKWNVTDRHARRYISQAKSRWTAEESEKTERARAMKVQSLKKLKRSLQERYKGTPQGIQAVLNVEKEIIKLQGLEPPKKIELDATITDLSKLPVEFS